MIKSPHKPEDWAADFPGELLARYKDPGYHIARFPFLINTVVDDGAALQHLRYQSVKPNEVFMGIAGFRSLDLLANIGASTGRMHDKALLFDGNLTQVKAMNAVLLMIERAQTPDEFIEQFIPHQASWASRVPRSSSPDDSSKPHKKQTQEDREYFSIHGAGVVPNNEADLRHYLDAQKQNIESWLYPANYARIKQMVDEGRILTPVIRLDDPERVESLQQWLTKKELSIADLYLSSVVCFAFNKPISDYYSQFPDKSAEKTFQGIEKLAGDHTRMLNAKPLFESEAEITGKNYRLALEDKKTAMAKVRTPVSSSALNLDHSFSVGPLSIQFQVENCSDDMSKAYGRLACINASIVRDEDLFMKLGFALENVVMALHVRDLAKTMMPISLDSSKSPPFIMPFNNQREWQAKMKAIQDILSEELSPIVKRMENIKREK